METLWILPMLPVAFSVGFVLFALYAAFRRSRRERWLREGFYEPGFPIIDPQTGKRNMWPPVTLKGMSPQPPVNPSSKHPFNEEEKGRVA
jgi:hypothetical protein